MIPLLDDFTHIELACKQLRDFPDNRPAINWVNCALGESLDSSRMASLAAILLTLLLLDLSFFKDRSWKRILLMALHPMVLVPFFWASQISTSLTALWAAIWLFTFQTALRTKTRKSTILSFASLIFIGIAGTLFRFEAALFAGTFLLLLLLHSPGRFKLQWKRAILATSLLSIPVARLVTGILQHLFRPLPSAPGAPLRFHEVSGLSYPPGAWLYLQMESILQYLKSIFLPWTMSFHGDWYEWWHIHLHRQEEVVKFGLTLLAIFASGIAIRHLLIRSRKEPGLIEATLQGIALFVCITAAFSTVVRTDWYYLTRAWMGSIAFLLWTSPLIAENRKIFPVVTALLFLSTTAHLCLHFSDKIEFRSYETEVTGAAHPFISFAEMKEYARNHRVDDAISSAHEVYARIPEDMARASDRAGAFWTLALYYGWVLNEQDQRKEDAKKILGVLGKSNYYPAIHACLQEESIPVSSCLEGKRKAIFCDSMGMEFPELETAHPYRITPKEICGFEPNQNR